MYTIRGSAKSLLLGMGYGKMKYGIGNYMSNDADLDFIKLRLTCPRLTRTLQENGKHHIRKRKKSSEESHRVE
jgi:hypothetical protein